MVLFCVSITTAEELAFSAIFLFELAMRTIGIAMLATAISAKTIASKGSLFLLLAGVALTVGFFCRVSGGLIDVISVGRGGSGLSMNLYF